MADIFKTLKITQANPGGPLNESLVGAVQASGNPADAGKVVLLGSSGKIDPSMLPVVSSAVSVNGTPVSNPDFNGSAPSPGGGYTAVVWTSDVGGNVSAWYVAGTPSFSAITSGTNTTAAMTVGSGAKIVPSGTGEIESTDLATTGAGVNVGGSAPPAHAGQLLISQPGNITAVWADPLVQGIQAEGTTASTVNPVLIAGVDGSGNLKNLVLDAAGDLQVDVANTVTANIQASGTPLTTVLAGSPPVVCLAIHDPASSSAVTQGTSPWVISGAVTTSGTATVIGTDSDNAANSTTKVPVIAARANAPSVSSIPTTPPVAWTEGHETPLSVDLQGTLRTKPGTPATAGWASLPINFSASGANVIVPLSGSTTVRVMRMFFVNSDPSNFTNITIQDTTPTSFSGAFRLISSGVFSGNGNGEPLYISGAGQGIQLNSSAAVQISGTVWYTQS